MTEAPKVEDHLPESRKKDFPVEQLHTAAVLDSAYQMRMGGKSFHEIAKALHIEGGWKAVYRLVADEYGELVAKVRVTDVRVQEAGRLMELRAGIETRARAGEEWAVIADLKMSERIHNLLGLDAASDAKSGAGGGVNVQVNITPPWEQGGRPAPDVVIEGEAVEED